VMLRSSMVVFFFSSRRRHTRLVSDWSSDVCSSDLVDLRVVRGLPRRQVAVEADQAQEDEKAETADRPLRTRLQPSPRTPTRTDSGRWRRWGALITGLARFRLLRAVRRCVRHVISLRDTEGP